MSDPKIEAVQRMYEALGRGKSVTLPLQHWFRFADGKIVSVRASEDSERTAAAFS